MKYNFEDELKKNSNVSETSYADENYRVVDGNNNIVRILSPGEFYGLHFFGKGVKPKVCYGKDKGCPVRDPEDKYEHAKVSARYVCIVLDRSDEKIKTAFFPYSVIKQVSDLQKNPDYGFEDLPMPYDIRITYKPKESAANKYKVDVKPKSPGLTQEQLDIFEQKLQKSSPAKIVERMKEKQMQADIDDGVILTEEKIKQEADSRMADYRASLPTEPQFVEKKVDYPEINPDDIPF